MKVDTAAGRGQPEGKEEDWAALRLTRDEGKGKRNNEERSGRKVEQTPGNGYDDTVSC